MDIDALMKRFRLASRDLFNHHFHRSAHDGDAFDGSERFDEVEECLFRAMVTWPAGLSETQYRELQPEIRLTSNTGRGAPCQVSRKPGVWEEDTLPETAQLSFVRFFDWMELDIRDNQYVWAEIVEWPGRTDLRGLAVLVESQYVRFIVTKEGARDEA
jgi:hypothetical protein